MITPTNTFIGLQTPRLKRLAEIVSAQAMAQQEKLESTADAYSRDDQDESQYGDEPEDRLDSQATLINGV